MEALEIGVIVKFTYVDLVIVPVYGGVAQLGEHRPCKAGVKSSNLFISILMEHKEYWVSNSVDVRQMI